MGKGFGGCWHHKLHKSRSSLLLWLNDFNPRWHLPLFLQIMILTTVSHYSIQIFGGVGIACLPLGLIFSFIRRPKAVITRSQYIKVLYTSIAGGILHVYYMCISFFMHCTIFMVVGCRKQLNWVKKQENWRKQLSPFIRKKEVVQRVESSVKMWNQ